MFVQTSNPKAKQRLRDTVIERESKALKITQKASISKKEADDAAMEVSVPEHTTIPSGDSSIWADVSPLTESAC